MSSRESLKVTELGDHQAWEADGRASEKKESKHSLANCNGSLHCVAWWEGALDSPFLPPLRPAHPEEPGQEGCARRVKSKSKHLEGTCCVSGTSRRSPLLLQAAIVPILRRKTPESRGELTCTVTQTSESRFKPVGHQWCFPQYQAVPTRQKGHVMSSHGRLNPTLGSLAV